MAAEVTLRHWLNLLPDEVCSQIAAHVTHGTCNRHGLSLAQTCKRMCHAVWSTLSHPVKLRLPYRWHSTTSDTTQKLLSSDAGKEGQEILKWAYVFRDYDVELDASPMIPRFIPYFEQVLSDCRVTHCTISNDEKLVNAVVKKDTIRRLTIELWHDIDIKVLFQAFSKMQLEELNVYGSLGFANRLQDLADACNALVSKNATLRLITWASLHMTEVGEDFDMESPTEHFRNVIEQFPTCCVIPLHTKPSERAIARLCQMRGVEIGHFPESVQVAGQLGTAVTSFTDESFGNYAAEQLEPLRLCTNLVDLDISVTPGTIGDLLKVIRHCRSIRSLRLVVDDGDTPSAGAMIEIVKVLPCLSELTLFNVMISIAEWEAMLKHMGGNLRNLCISQTESKELVEFQADRVEAIMMSMTTHNRNLREMYFDPIEAPSDLEWFVKERDKVLKALAHKVQAAIPFLNHGTFARDSSFFFFVEGE